MCGEEAPSRAGQVGTLPGGLVLSGYASQEGERASGGTGGKLPGRRSALWGLNTEA